MKLSGAGLEWNCAKWKDYFWGELFGLRQISGVELFAWKKSGVELSGLELSGVELSGVELSRVELFGLGRNSRVVLFAW